MTQAYSRPLVGNQGLQACRAKSIAVRSRFVRSSGFVLVFLGMRV